MGTSTGILAWYRLDPQGWSFRPNSMREQLIIGAADAYAQLTKRTLHLRVTTRPYPVSHWAIAHDRNAPAPLPGWRDHLLTEQRYPAGRSMADKEVYVRVSIPTPTGLHGPLAALGRAIGPVTDRDVKALAKQVRAVTEAMALQGVDEAPATPRELEWLLHRSVGLGLPAPTVIGAAAGQDWDLDDLHEFTDRVHWSATPYGRTVRVVGEIEDRQITRSVDARGGGPEPLRMVRTRDVRLE